MGQIQSSRRQFLHYARNYCALASLGTMLPSSSSAHLFANVVQPPTSWPLFRGDAHATGVAHTTLPASLEVLWDYTVENGAFEATPVIVDGICYIGDLDGKLYALRLADGKEVWTQETDSFGFASSAALSKDRFFLGDIDGKFQCFDLQGKAQWEFLAQAEISSSASFYEDKVLFGSQDATLYCLDAASGKLAWKIEVQDQIRCSPTVVGDRSFVAGCDGRLHIINLKEKKEEGAPGVDIRSPTGVTPAVMGNHVYFGTEGGDIFCVDWRKAEVVWVSPAGRLRREVRSCPAVDTDLVVIGNRNKILYALDPKDGAEKWTFMCKRSVDSSPIILNDQVFTADSGGTVYLLDRLTGKEKWRKEVGGSFSGSPAVVGQRVVIANDNGVVYCFGEKPA